jgi:hypothetical protein
MILGLLYQIPYYLEQGFSEKEQGISKADPADFL